MLPEINLQKSLEKLALLNLVQQQLEGQTSVLALSLKATVNNSADSILKTIKDCTNDNRSMMITILGAPLISKIYSL